MFSTPRSAVCTEARLSRGSPLLPSGHPTAQVQSCSRHIPVPGRGGQCPRPWWMSEPSRRHSGLQQAPCLSSDVPPGLKGQGSGPKEKGVGGACRGASPAAAAPSPPAAGSPRPRPAPPHLQRQEGIVGTGLSLHVTWAGSPAQEAPSRCVRMAGKPAETQQAGCRGWWPHGGRWAEKGRRQDPLSHEPRRCPRAQCAEGRGSSANRQRSCCPQGSF